MMTKHDYAFELKMYAVIRLQAGCEAEARQALLAAFDGVDVTVPQPNPALTPLLRASLYVDDELGPHLLEVDGADADD